MIPESLKQQIDRWLDGDLPVENELELQQAFESIPEALEFLGDRALLHEMLAKSVAIDNTIRGAKLGTTTIADSFKPTSGYFTRWLTHPWAWLSSAIVVCVILISMIFLPSSVASPTELVQKTLAGYRPAIDRCYTVKVEAGGGPRRKGISRRSVPSDSTLWIRGESFIQSYHGAGAQLVWGRNAQGAVWFTIAGRSAALFAANEIPEVLQEVCDLRILQLPTLLESLLHDYDLEYVSRGHGSDTILAHPRPAADNAKYGTVEIDIEPQSLLVRRVTLERLNNKRVVAVVSFSLEEMRQREDSLYELHAHLQADAQVFDRGARLGKRSDLLREFLQKLRASRTSEP